MTDVSGFKCKNLIILLSIVFIAGFEFFVFVAFALCWIALTVLRVSFFDQENKKIGVIDMKTMNSILWYTTAFFLCLLTIREVMQVHAYRSAELRKNIRAVDKTSSFEHRQEDSLLLDAGKRIILIVQSYFRFILQLACYPIAIIVVTGHRCFRCLLFYNNHSNSSDGRERSFWADVNYWHEYNVVHVIRHDVLTFFFFSRAYRRDLWNILDICLLSLSWNVLYHWSDIHPRTDYAYLDKTVVVSIIIWFRVLDYLKAIEIKVSGEKCSFFLMNKWRLKTTPRIKKKFKSPTP